MESLQPYQTNAQSKHDVLIINCPTCRNESRVRITSNPMAMSCGCDSSAAFSDEIIDKTRQSIEVLKQTLGDLAV